MQELASSGLRTCSAKKLSGTASAAAIAIFEKRPADVVVHSMNEAKDRQVLVLGTAGSSRTWCVPCIHGKCIKLAVLGVLCR